MSIQQPQFTGPLTDERGSFSQYWQRLFAQLFQQVNGLNTNPFFDQRKFSALPTTPGVLGSTAIITDSNTNTWGANVAGGGTFIVLAWFNGVHWTVLGK